MLDVEQPVVAGRKTTRFGMPSFRAGIRRINADINHLGNFQAPVTHDLETFAVPRGIRNDVDCDIYVERADRMVEQARELVRKSGKAMVVEGAREGAEIVMELAAQRQLKTVTSDM